MKRLFEKHILREIKNFDGFWDFIKDEQDVGTEQKWHKSFPENTELMTVPGCWDTKPQHFDYNGKGWYRRKFFMREKKNILLTFEAVSGIAEVFLDGVKLGKHNGSYTPFSFFKRSVPAGSHELIVKVDNYAYPGKVMPDYSDWHLYGGIFRPVELSLLDKVWIKELKIDYRISKGGVSLSPLATIKNLTNTSLKDKIIFEINNKKIAEFELILKPGEEKQLTYKLGNFDLPLWSPDSPKLHCIKLSYAGDDLQTRTGFRSIKIKDGKFFINGKALKLLGINRHHEYGDNGFTVPPEITLRDFEIIRDMGCNAVRGHYPVDSYAMDICDELGLLVWSEIPLWGRWAHVVAQKRYLKLAEQALEEMITRDQAHPSVFAWSVMNECDSNIPDGEYTAKRLTNKARELDSTRFVTYATKHPLDDLGYKHVDLIGVNSYPGWYSKGNSLEWPELISRLKSKLKKEKLQKLPILITETGAGAIYGDRGLESRKWSENTQADILKKTLSFALSSDDVAGIFIWQFCDIRTQTRNMENRPGCFNNKGVLDRFRRPKLAYYVLKEFYTGF